MSDLGAASNARARTETAPPERRAMLVECWRREEERGAEEAPAIETDFCIALIA